MPASTLLRTRCDREGTRSPLTFDEVWEQPEVRGSQLPEDHYHQMLNNFPSFSQLMLHEVQNKKQRFWNLVEEADHSGEKFSDADLKIFIYDKNPSETVPPFGRNSLKKRSRPGGWRWMALMPPPINFQFGTHFKSLPPRCF